MEYHNEKTHAKPEQWRDHLSTSVALEERRWLERQLVAAAMRDPDGEVLADARRFVEPSDFACAGMRATWEVLCKLGDIPNVLSISSVYHELSRSNRMHLIDGGIAGLSQVEDELATTSLTRLNAARLREISLRGRERMLLAEATESGLSDQILVRLGELHAELAQIAPFG